MSGGAYLDHRRRVFHVSPDGERAWCAIPCDQLERVEGEWAPTMPLCRECHEILGGRCHGFTPKPQGGDALREAVELKRGLIAYVAELRARRKETSGGGEPGKGLVSWQIADEMERRFLGGPVAVSEESGG